jgi:hypothetical protein
MERVCDEVLVRMCREDYVEFSKVMLYWISDGLGTVGCLSAFNTFLYNVRLMFEWFEGKDIPSVIYGFGVVDILKRLFSHLAYNAPGFKVDDCEMFWKYVYGKIEEFHNREGLTTWELSALISAEIIGIAVGKEDRFIFEKNVGKIESLRKTIKGLRKT